MESSQQDQRIDSNPFSCGAKAVAITTKYVMDGSRPVLAILRDEDGEWQILCDTTDNPDDGMVVCLGCLYSRFPFIGQFASLPRGWEASRPDENSDWEILQTEWED